jgi:hypothetical protein
MYTRLEKFARESEGVFAESQLVKIFLSKINKIYINSMLQNIIMDYNGHVILAEAFPIFEQCDCALYQHNDIDVVSLPVESSKFLRILVAAPELVDIEVDKTLYCWSCGQTGHVKNECL